MRIKKKTPLLVWSLTGLIIMSFFIPWARYSPDSTLTNTGDFLKHFASEDDHFLYSYLLIRPKEWNDLWKNPADGISGYQLVLLSDNESLSAKIGQAFINLLWKDDSAASLWIKIILFAPLLSLAAGIAFLPRKPQFKWLIAIATAQILLYLFLRWKLNDSYAERILSIELGIGLWSTLYLSLTQSFVLLYQGALGNR